MSALPSKADKRANVGLWAEEVRVIVEQLTDEKSKEAMLRIANDYDKLAERQLRKS
jgi:hypothetical protein